MGSKIFELVILSVLLPVPVGDVQATFIILFIFLKNEEAVVAPSVVVAHFTRGRRRHRYRRLLTRSFRSVANLRRVTWATAVLGHNKAGFASAVEVGSVTARGWSWRWWWWWPRGVPRVVPHGRRSASNRPTRRRRKRRRRSRRCDAVEPPHCLYTSFDNPDIHIYMDIHARDKTKQRKYTKNKPRTKKSPVENKLYNSYCMHYFFTHKYISNWFWKPRKYEQPARGL